MASLVLFSFNAMAEIQDYSDFCSQQSILLSNDLLCCEDTPTYDGYYHDYSCFSTDYTGWLTITDTDCIEELRNVGLCNNSSYKIITDTDPQLICYSGGGCDYLVSNPVTSVDWLQVRETSGGIKVFESTEDYMSPHDNICCITEEACCLHSWHDSAYPCEYAAGYSYSLQSVCNNTYQGQFFNPGNFLEECTGGGAGVGDDCSYMFETYFNSPNTRILASGTTCNNMYVKVQSEAAHLILEHCYGSIADSPYAATGSKLTYCPQQNQYLSGETKLTKKTDLQRVFDTVDNPYCKTCPTVDGYDGINFSYYASHGKTSITDCVAIMSPSTQTTSDDTGTYEMSLQSTCSYTQ